MNLSDPPQQVTAFKIHGGYQQLWQHCQSRKATSNPECVTPEKSFWSQGGTDPLDYIYIFRNEGNEEDIPRHWHYVGMGLSDIHGYSIFRLQHERLRELNRDYEKATQPLPDLFPPPLGDEKRNGFGFELTARIRCNSDEEWLSKPPVWPLRILQDLARYVYQSRNTFSVGDHVAWHSPLDSDSEVSDSRIEHILMTLDPELTEAHTNLGPVKFIQIVGAFEEELQAAREWNVRGILEMMKERPETGGCMLITDMTRGQTIFELDPKKEKELQDAIERMGSDMVQISNRHKTSLNKKPDWFKNVENGSQPEGSFDLDETDKDYGLDSDLYSRRDEMRIEEDYPQRPSSRMSCGSESALKFENSELEQTRYYDHVYILLSYESARLLPVMLKGRLKHNRTFTFQSFKGDSTITFKPEGNKEISLATAEFPFARHTHWLQIYVSDRLLNQMIETIDKDLDTRFRKRPITPTNYSWPEFNLHFTIVEEIDDV